jgi:hypothetical protein
VGSFELDSQKTRKPSRPSSANPGWQASIPPSWSASHEAAKLLPRTFEALGRDAAPIFEEFAAGFWPEGATRHAQDASAFCGWLAARKDLRLDPEERLRLRFALGKQHVLLGLVRRLKTDRGCRFGLLAVVRRQGRVHVLRIYLALPGRATDLVPLR